jgi:predicted  nucleic acid-binding Zn ribbon protein
MESIKLTEGELVRLESIFNTILADFPNNPMINKYIKILMGFISDYRSNGTYVQNEITREITFVINYLRAISKESSVALANAAKESCKSCIFHVDHCMINVFFIIFKSLELKKFIDFKDLRPSMRMMF